MEIQSTRSPAQVRLIGTVILIILVAALFEGGARIAFSMKDYFGARADLHDYQMMDARNHNLWRLRPGYSATLQQAIRAEQDSGRVLRVEYLRAESLKLHVHPDDMIFHINEAGFKGPELDKSHSRLRILTLGDSCTFGTELDEYSYPRILERVLRQMGWGVEVVNGAVEGYSPKHALMRIAEYKDLKPEITTIYIGWNGLSSDDALPQRYQPYSLRLVRSAYERLLPQRAALAAYTKPKYPDKTDPQFRRLDGYVPPFMSDVEEIVRQMKAAGSTVVLVTLPGLYTTEREPSPHALQVGHLPSFTNNPYVFAKMAERYNTLLRELAKQRNLQLIDLDRWADTAFEPRDAYFVDSVHLYADGEQKIGEYLAQKLVPTLANTAKPSAPSTAQTITQHVQIPSQLH